MGFLFCCPGRWSFEFGHFCGPPSGIRTSVPTIERGVFLADRIFLRGWAPFVRAAPDKGRSAGISREKREQLWSAIREKLTEGQKNLILRTASIDAILKSKNEWPGVRPGATLYASVDRPQWQKDRYSVTKSAEEVLEPGVPLGLHLTVDTNSGEIWGEKSDVTVLLGRYDKATNSWMWLDSELERVADVRARFLAVTQEF